MVDEGLARSGSIFSHDEGSLYESFQVYRACFGPRVSGRHDDDEIVMADAAAFEGFGCSGRFDESEVDRSRLETGGNCPTVDHVNGDRVTRSIGQKPAEPCGEEVLADRVAGSQAEEARLFGSDRGDTGYEPFGRSEYLVSPLGDELSFGRQTRTRWTSLEQLESEPGFERS